MKNSMIIMLVLLGIPAWSQKKIRAKVDTIWAETGEQKTFVYFQGDIRFIDVGSGKRDFSASFTADCAVFKAVHQEALPTSVMIDYGDGYYHGTLAYKSKLTVKQAIIDFREKESQDSIPHAINETRAITSKDDEVDKSIVAQRMGVVEGNTKDKIKTIAIKEDRFLFSIVDLRKDESFLFIKLFIQNDSKSDYKINLFDFAYFDGSSEDDVKAPKYVSPYLPKKLPADKEKVLRTKKVYYIFAIPYLSLGKGGKLIVSVHEKDGTRVMKLTIPGKLLIDSDNF